LTTVLPSGGLAGYESAINDLSLTLAASQNIENNGAMTSAGNLTVLAGGTITNTPTAGASGGATLRANGELNLLSDTVANQGVVSSTAGNVDVAVPSIFASAAGPFAGAILPKVLSQNISINNTSGTIQALSGTINLGGTGLGPSAVLCLTGGNFAAQAINVQAGKGAIPADVNNVAGPVNVSGGTIGAAGGGGSISIESRIGTIQAQLVSANGGGTSPRQGSSGSGGNGGIKGGLGGAIGEGTAGGRGGTIGIASTDGDITLNGVVRATGSSGGGVSGLAGDGGFGVDKGLNGGTVAAAGSGGAGGAITIDATSGTLTVPNLSNEAADGAPGGNQSEKGGKGGDSDNTGGKGGDVRQAGSGGAGGTITINYSKLITVSPPSSNKPTANGGAAGVQSGTAGDGGTAPISLGPGDVDRTSAKPLGCRQGHNKRHRPVEKSWSEPETKLPGLLHPSFAAPCRPEEEGYCAGCRHCISRTPGGLTRIVGRTAWSDYWAGFGWRERTSLARPPLRQRS
jgi:hypothetical protein